MPWLAAKRRRENWIQNQPWEGWSCPRHNHSCYGCSTCGAITILMSYGTCHHGEGGHMAPRVRCKICYIYLARFVYKMIIIVDSSWEDARKSFLALRNMNSDEERTTHLAQNRCYFLLVENCSFWNPTLVKKGII